MDIKERATAKVGPLPVWGWVVLASVAGYILYKHMQNKKSAQTVNATGPVTTVPHGNRGIGEDTGVQEQLNDINAGIGTADNELAQIGTNVGDTNKTVKSIGTVITRPPTTQKYGAADVQSYFIVHDTKTGKYWYVHPADKTIFVLKDATAKADINKFKAKVIQKPGQPQYKGELLTFV